MTIALICGGAVGVWEQRDEALALIVAAGLGVVSIAINDAMTTHPDPLHHAVSLHPDKFEGWERRRVERGLGGGYQKWTQTARRHHGTLAVRRWKDGSSGLTALDVALNQVGCAGVILCGIPLDGSRNVFRGQPWAQFKRYRYGFLKAAPEFAGRVRSMAGWTRELLGAPDAEWLAGFCVPA